MIIDDSFSTFSSFNDHVVSCFFCFFFSAGAGWPFHLRAARLSPPGALQGMVTFARTKSPSDVGKYIIDYHNI